MIKRPNSQRRSARESCRRLVARQKRATLRPAPVSNNTSERSGRLEANTNHRAAGTLIIANAASRAISVVTAELGAGANAGQTTSTEALDLAASLADELVIGRIVAHESTLAVVVACLSTSGIAPLIGDGIAGLVDRIERAKACTVRWRRCRRVAVGVYFRPAALGGARVVYARVERGERSVVVANSRIGLTASGAINAVAVGIAIRELLAAVRLEAVNAHVRIENARAVGRHAR